MWLTIKIKCTQKLYSFYGTFWAFQIVRRKYYPNNSTEFSLENQSCLHSSEISKLRTAACEEEKKKQDNEVRISLMEKNVYIFC